ncbi:MAG: dUTP diphosphatase [Clostridia bacterium]|nr:dUTP diphosphatase [Clostridia bacterium]
MRIRGFEVCKGYEDKDINLPIRKTKNSVGYDLEAAEDVVIPTIWKTVFENVKRFMLGKHEYDEIKPTLIKTGLKAYFLEDEALFLANRSSNPMKKGLILANSIGVIESDYYENPDNDGHIMYAYYNFFPVDTHIKKHDAIGQAYFQKFLVADGDNATGERKGGFGSTDEVVNKE